VEGATMPPLPYELTDAEIDDIEAMVAQLEYDLMVTDEMYPTDRARITRVAAQTIPAATDTAIFFDAEDYDPQGMHDNVTDNQRIYVVNDGLHLIDANLICDGAVIGYRYLKLRKFRSVPAFFQTYNIQYQSNLNLFAGNSLSLTFQDEAVVGDFYELRVYQTSGYPMDVVKNDWSPYFSVVRL